MKRHGLIITLAILLTACAGVGAQRTGNAPDNAVGSTQHGYLSVASNGVAFVQFVNNNGQLAGQLQGVDAMNGQAHSYNEALTGTLNNGQISMSVSWFGISETFTGTLDGSNLILNFPDNNGYLRSTTFQSATIDDYNNAVSTFESQIQAEQQAAANAQATAAVVDATATTVSDEQNRLNYDLQNIGGTIQQLQNDSDFSNILNVYSNDLQLIQKDYQTEQSDAAGGCSNINTVGIDDNTVSVDHNEFGVDDNSLNIQNSSVQDGISSVTDFIQKIQQHWNNLGHQSPGIAQSDIDNVVSNGNNAINQAKSNMSDASSKASQFDSQANSIQKQADALFNGMHC